GARRWPDDPLPGTAGRSAAGLSDVAAERLVAGERAYEPVQRKRPILLRGCTASRTFALKVTRVPERSTPKSSSIVRYVAPAAKRSVGTGEVSRTTTSEPPPTTKMPARAVPE